MSKIDIIQKINQKLSRYLYLEMKVYSFKDNELIIVAGKDLIYYHSYEIKFINVSTILLNSEWNVSPSENHAIQLIDKAEAKKINMSYKVIQGNNVYKILNDDNLPFYVVAENISYEEKTVKYY